MAPQLSHGLRNLLRTYYVLITILSTGDRKVKKIQENICSGPVYILVGRDIIKKKVTRMLKGC